MSKYVKPVAGRCVPDPEKGGFLPEAGRRVELTQYWLRRLADGDIHEAEPPPESTDTPPQTATNPVAVAVSEPAPRKQRAAEEG